MFSPCPLFCQENSHQASVFGRIVWHSSCCVHGIFIVWWCCLATMVPTLTKIIMFVLRTNLKSFNPFIPKISLVILLTVYHTILLMLVWRIWYWMNYNYPNWYFPLVHHLSAWYCIDIVRRNSLLVTHRSERVNHLIGWKLSISVIKN